MRPRSILVLPIVALVATAGSLPGQGPASPRRGPVAAALEAVRANNEWTLAQQESICEVAAPPFGEDARAIELRRRFEALGFRNVRIDAEGNVIAERPGAGRGPRVVLSAHLDTVFPDTVDVTVRRDGTRLRGPGIADDCRGLAVILTVARALREAEVRTTGSIVFVGTVGEEGQGNLRGVRHFVDHAGSAGVDYFVSVDGSGLTAVSRGVGSARYRVTVRGPGGHSYGDFGIPNPVHALGRAIAGIAAIPVPVNPKTTFNVGMIEGGTSVNSIAMAAAMDLDLRSESQTALDTLDARARKAVAQAIEAEHQRWPGARARLSVEWLEIGRRPASSQADTSAVLRATLAAARSLGFTPALTASSTDANYPMSLGIPSVTIDGGGTSGGAHSLGEWYDDGRDGWRGPQWALLLVLTLAGVAN